MAAESKRDEEVKQPKLVWCVERLDTVIRAWGKQYKAPVGQAIQGVDWWLDPTKGTVIFRLYVGEE